MDSERRDADACMGVGSNARERDGRMIRQPPSPKPERLGIRACEARSACVAEGNDGAASGV